MREGGSDTQAIVAPHLPSLGNNESCPYSGRIFNPLPISPPHTRENYKNAPKHCAFFLEGALGLTGCFRPPAAILIFAFSFDDLSACLETWDLC